jgi:hypothetical protein
MIWIIEAIVPLLPKVDWIMDLLIAPVESLSGQHFKDQRTLGGQFHMGMWMFARTIDHKAPCSP